jgi:hypothetical protein
VSASLHSNGGSGTCSICDTRAKRHMLHVGVGVDGKRPPSLKRESPPVFREDRGRFFLFQGKTEGKTRERPSSVGASSWCAMGDLPFLCAIGDLHGKCQLLL